MCFVVGEMMKKKGRLIVFEGVDAAGKTTLCEELCVDLANKGIPVQRIHFPGKDPGTLGELVYRIHHQYWNKFNIPNISPCALQVLHIAAHIDAIETKIKNYIAGGDWVVLDRFWWSTYVYGIASEVSAESLDIMIELEKEAWGALVPDVVFLIDSATPLRDDELDSDSWQSKRKLYVDLLEKEKSYYKCRIVETKVGSHGKLQALAKINNEISDYK
jgi:dTMP kinase